MAGRKELDVTTQMFAVTIKMEIAPKD